MTKAKVVYVEWVDSDSIRGWRSKIPNLRSMAEDPLHKCQSAGILYKQTDDRLVIVQSIGEDTVQEILRIPRIAVTKIKILGYVEVNWGRSND